MRVKGEQRGVDAVVVRDDFARIVSVTRAARTGRPTEFVYEFSYLVDQVGAVRSSVDAVEFHISIDKPRKGVGTWAVVGSQVVSPNAVVVGVAASSATIKDRALATAAAATHVATGPATVVASLSAQVAMASAADEVDAAAFLTSRKSVVSVPVEAGVDMPLMKVSSNTSRGVGIVTDPQPKGYNMGSLQASSLDVILNSRLDPSDAHGANVSITPTAAAFAGISPNPGDVELSVGPKSVAIAPKRLTAFANLMSKPATLGSSLDLVTGVDVPVVRDEPVRTVEVSKRVVVPAALLGAADTFYVELRTTSRGAQVGTTMRIVRHGRLLATFETPRRPPLVKAAPVQVPGRNVVEVRQLDDQAVAVRVYRRTLGRTTDVNDASSMAYEFACEVPVSVADGSMKFVDVVNNTGTVVYRFIPVGFGGRIGSIFENVVVSGTRRTMKRRRRVVHAAIDVVAEGDHTNVYVTNVVKGPVAVALQRKNLTTFEAEFSYVSDRPIVLTDGEEAIKFVDSAVKDGNIYEYRLLLYFEDGSEELSTAHAVYEYVAQDRRGVEIVVSDPQVSRIADTPTKTSSRRGAAFDVRFSIRSNIASVDDDMLRSVIVSSGLSDLYADELVAARSKLSDMVAHSVQRVNTSTGRIEDFGTVTGGVFSDVEVGRTRAAKPVVPGVRYRYIITTLLRSPETMFEDFEKTNTTGLTSREYTYKPSKYRHPIALKTGTLTTSATRRVRHARDEFSYGMIGNARSVEVTVPALDMKLIRPVVQRVDRITNAVRWQVVGDMSIVDYFLVVHSHLGTDQVVGKVHAMGDTAAFEFLHDLERVDVGTCTYTIRSMLTNFEAGPVLTTGRVVV